MDNALKLLMSEADLHDLKKLSIELESYQNTILLPLKDTSANEIRRAMNYYRKVEVACRETEKIIASIKAVLTERT